MIFRTTVAVAAKSPFLYCLLARGKLVIAADLLNDQESKLQCSFGSHTSALAQFPLHVPFSF